MHALSALMDLQVNPTPRVTGGPVWGGRPSARQRMAAPHPERYTGPHDGPHANVPPALSTSSDRAGRFRSGRDAPHSSHAPARSPYPEQVAPGAAHRAAGKEGRP
ncbi:hypothetical protein GCM10010842_08170 [Deinococcus daejeonensis]|uniref:Uncharacterized protein n=1 Tax=Deinococcus daejeonensis TaxID=1007098 RepID=A0ABQ2IYN9_9DEIO|nr:hypothetical protein GCM10010842_08170 [Deinococcus daejeonensis]